ncbi:MULTISPECIES: polysaccharide deacetylase family protein [Nocardiaceae]|uniref:Polysaccharide deacetylase family protein n=1 Tax=Rhodococcoides kroppenstedtii TaxID=293050 RepID=A0ABS7NT71_9NOCA|nr:MULTISPECIES: polysaccharide deacetylase family protein [Rhodococcus]AMY20655.1 Peptidoglycan deacetylase [Rhodococcus sp. PBTS 1]MBY6313320.1 polysaccharide deacetylase family protein [Rhodococcus kroppenstedtii]MBY6321211.1 polysaccharide deacetylase family protein [Rhodococcus kroppenstedtii]MBY6400370.1 polysaccharide deacetylase family protein [Rhodococcus kroppenstedtii]
MLPSHDRFGYSPITERPQFTWPGGGTLAVYVAVNCEHFAYGATDLGYTPGGQSPDTYNWAWREWGNRVGAFRLADTLREVGIRPTVLVNAEIYDHAPQVVEALRVLGGEVVAHGRTNSRIPVVQDEDEERRSIEHVRAVIERYEGAAPRGWMSPGAAPSAVTEDLLAENGFDYTLDWPVDDRPVWLRTRSRPILSVPYPHEINDLPVIVHHHGTGRDFADRIVDTVDELSEQSRQQSVVLSISTHTFLTGQPDRLRHFRRALHHVVETPGVWLTTPGDIADHYRTIEPPPT